MGWLLLFGASDLTRTGDLLITSEMHYRLCYTSKPKYYSFSYGKSQLPKRRSRTYAWRGSDPTILLPRPSVLLRYSSYIFLLNLSMETKLKTDPSSTATTTLSPGDMLEGSAEQNLPWVFKAVNKGFDLAYRCFCDDVNC